MRALALLLCLLSAQAWGATDAYVRAPWRAVTWIHAPDLLWVVTVTIALIAVWVARLLRGDRDERRLGSLLAVFLLVGVSLNAKLAGTVWYARPAADCANNGNGTAYSCAASAGAAGAWRTMANVAWGVGNVDSGDTLRACSSESSPFTTADYDGSNNAMLDIGQSGVAIDGDCSAAGGGTMAYMTGNSTRDYGVACWTNTVCPGLTLRNLHIEAFDGRGVYVRNDLTASNVANFTADNLEVEDIIGSEGSLPSGIVGFGSGATLTNIEVTRTTDDNIVWSGDRFYLRDWTTIYPAYNHSTYTGDCVQVVTAADKATVMHGYCDKRNSTVATNKQCVIFGDPATGSDGVISDVTCLLPETGNAANATKALYSVLPGTRFERNYVLGGYYGIYMLGAGSRAIGNILVGQELRGIDAVSTVTSGTHTIANNTVFDVPNGIVLNGGASVTNDVYNNLVVNATTAYTKGGAGTLNQDYNAAFNSTTNSNGAGTIDITADPQLAGGENPRDAEDFCLQTGSPLLAAGTYIGAWATGYAGEDLGKPPSIGARGLCYGRPLVTSRPAVSSRPSN